MNPRPSLSDMLGTYIHILQFEPTRLSMRQGGLADGLASLAG